MRLFLCPVFFTIACTSDKGITAFNNDPEVEITSHEDGDRLIVGEAVQFSANVSDVNHGPENLRVSWANTDGVLCSEAVPDSGGVAICDAVISIADLEISVEVKDDQNATGSDALTLDIISFDDTENDPPTAEIISPTIDVVYYSDQKVLLVAQVSDAEDTVDNLLVAWRSDIDGELDIVAVPNSSGETNNALYLSEGEHFLTLSVEDSGGLKATDSLLFTVGISNRAPTCTLTAPQSGDESVQGEVVIFQGTAEDLDVPADWLSVNWTSTNDGTIGNTTPNSSGGITFPYSDLSVGTHVVSMQVLDEVGASCVQDVVLTITDSDTPEPTSDPTSEPEPTVKHSEARSPS